MASRRRTAAIGAMMVAVGLLIAGAVTALRGFQRVTLAPGAGQTVSFTLEKGDFGFYDNSGAFVVEPGTIDVYAGDSSHADMTQSFTVSR